ncbi:hypothetical protein D3C85_661260 [compost metagenome]
MHNTGDAEAGGVIGIIGVVVVAIDITVVGRAQISTDLNQPPLGVIPVINLLSQRAARSAARINAIQLSGRIVVQHQFLAGTVLD